MSQNIDKGRLQQFHSLEFLAKQVVEGFITGLHKSPFHGFLLNLPSIACITPANRRDISTGNCMEKPKGSM